MNDDDIDGYDPTLAEQALLGSLLIDNLAFDKISDLVRPGDFARREHRVLFAAIVEQAALQQHFDILTLGDALHASGTLEAAGGINYLRELSASIATSANAPHYARVVRERSDFRAVVHACSEGVAAARSPGERDAAGVIAKVEADLFSIGERRSSGAGPESVGAIGPRVMERIRLAAERKSSLVGSSTGFTDLDRMTGGLEPGTLTILGARPSMGKTALACQIAQAVAMGEDRPVAIFSMEMNGDSLFMRMVSNLGRIDHTRLRTGQMTPHEWDRSAEAFAAINASKLSIDSTPALTSAEIRSRARRIRREKGDLALIVIDYLQLMGTADSRAQNRNLELTAISRDVKTMATELSVPVIALSQLNRSLEQRSDKRPVMSDLRESGALEQDADLVWFLYRDEVYNEASRDAGTAEVIIAKQRNGPIGITRLAFQGRFVRFDNLARQDQDMPDFGRHPAAHNDLVRI